MRAFIPPELTAESEPFWRSGSEGRLLIARCRACGLFLHPPRPACRRCRSMDIGHQPVSGRGTVHSVTSVHHGFVAGVDLPYLVALIELDEQPGLRLLTNVVECAPEQVHIGMRVSVVFEPVEGADGVSLPRFRPEDGR
ncbi:MAG: DNA-binding protein [Chloroflexi bacterium]|nr:MAG: DNA-binding protein [Chloroflexota bacterium]